MKTYKAVMTFIADPENVHEQTNDTAMDLVNIEDDTDRIMCADDEFTEGELLTEDQFIVRDCSYVYDEGVGNADFAFRTIPTF